MGAGFNFKRRQNANIDTLVEDDIMGLFTSKRTKTGGTTMTQRRNTKTGKSSISWSTTTGNKRTTRTITSESSRTKTRKTKLW